MNLKYGIDSLLLSGFDHPHPMWNITKSISIREDIKWDGFRNLPIIIASLLSRLHSLLNRTFYLRKIVRAARPTPLAFCAIIINHPLTCSFFFAKASCIDIVFFLSFFSFTSYALGVPSKYLNVPLRIRIVSSTT